MLKQYQKHNCSDFTRKFLNYALQPPREQKKIVVLKFVRVLCDSDVYLHNTQRYKSVNNSQKSTIITNCECILFLDRINATNICVYQHAVSFTLTKFTLPISYGYKKESRCQQLHCTHEIFKLTPLPTAAHTTMIQQLLPLYRSKYECNRYRIEECKGKEWRWNVLERPPFGIFALSCDL